MPTFKALRVHQDGNGVAARVERIALDALTPGDVVIRVRWSGINYKDALAVTGRGKILRGFPKVGGIDLAGVVEDSASPDFKPGDEVLVTGCNIGEALDGGYAEYARLPAAAVVPLPKGLTLREAMALGTAGFTAALALRRMLENHQRPEMGPIAVTGATGGVGSVAVSLFAKTGFTVAAITGKADRSRDYLEALGASEVLDRKALELGTRPLEKALWGGAVDNLGGATLAWLTRTVKPWGNIACIGLAQGPELNTTVMPFILRGASLLGVHSVECPRPWRLEIWKRLADDWKPPQLDRIVAREIALDGVPRACEAVIAGGAQGRTLVRL